MDLRSRLDPKDGVNLYEQSGGYERERGDRGRKEGSGLKYQLLKKGKPYTRFAKDNKSLRLTREKYFEVADKQDVRKMREEYDKLNQTLRESSAGRDSKNRSKLGLPRNTTIRNVDDSDFQESTD